MIRKNIENKKLENVEYQITIVLDEVREKKGMVAFIPKGEMLDVGNVKAYQNTFIEMSKK